MDVTLKTLQALIADQHVEKETVETIIAMIGEVVSSDEEDYDAREAYIHRVLGAEAFISGFMSGE